MLASGQTHNHRNGYMRCFIEALGIRATHPNLIPTPSHRICNLYTKTFAINAYSTQVATLANTYVSGITSSVHYDISFLCACAAPSGGRPDEVRSRRPDEVRSRRPDEVRSLPPMK